MSRRRAWGEDSTVRIDLSEGASVTLSFKGNLFDLTGEERALVAALSSVIQQHRDRDSGSLNENQPLVKEAQHG